MFGSRRLRVRFAIDRGVVDPLLLAGGVDRLGDVLRGQRLAVGPFGALAQLVGPRAPVVGVLPGLGQAGNRREVVGRLVGERRVLDVPRLVGGDRDADQRVHAVDALRVADVEHRRLAVLAAGRHGHAHQEGERAGSLQPASVRCSTRSLRQSRMTQAPRLSQAVTSDASRGTARADGRSRAAARRAAGRAPPSGR